MIRFTIDGPDDGPGYVLCADAREAGAGAIGGVGPEAYLFSRPLRDPKAIALQARELADAAAALLEQLPERAKAFEHLHDAIDALPKPEGVL